MSIFTRCASVLGSLLLFGTPTLGSPQGDPPNILVILIDDLGVEQIECFDAIPPLGSALTPGSNRYAGGSYTPAVPYGPGYAPTPNLTQLAEDGIRFSRCFTSPTCSPSRAQLMTGRYPFRTQIGTVVNPSGVSNLGAQQQLDLSEDEVLLPEMVALSPAGYRSALFGKWHLARDPSNKSGVGFEFGDLQTQNPILDVPGDSHPVLAGWPFFQGHMHNLNVRPNPVFDADPPVCEADPTCSPGYRLWYHVTSVMSNQPSLPPTLTSRTVTDRFDDGDYATTRQRRELEQWILSSDEPFFAVWSTSAPHGPYDWPPGGALGGACDCGLDCTVELHGYGCSPPDGELFPRATYTRFRAMVEALDTEIGRLRDNLGAALWDATTVILVGDNGTPKTVVRDAETAIPGLMDPYLPCASGPGSPLPCLGDIPSTTVRFKGTPYVTGTNVPLIVSGASVANVLEGTTSDALVDMVDVFDTVRELAGVDDQSSQWNQLIGNRLLDSTSFAGVLDGSSAGARDRSLAMQYTPNGPFPCRTSQRIGFTLELPSGAIYRLIRTGLCGSAPDELYRLVDDQGIVDDWLEEADVAATDPNLAAVQSALEALLDQACTENGCNAPCEPCTSPCTGCP